MDDAARQYYARGREQGRLTDGHDLVEFWRTTELLQRWLPGPPARVLDVGGAAGAHALPLAARGYVVDLVDPAPVHVEQALAASSAAPVPLASATPGDARALAVQDASVDAVLLLGPLYHLTEAADRALALSEAFRVLRPGGVVVAAVISRFASALDAVTRGGYTDDEFAAIVEQDPRTGLHRNDSRRPGWFTTAYFHHPDELVDELGAAGFVVDGPVAVEGIAGLAPEPPADPVARERLLALVRATEREPSLLGLGGHLLAQGRKAATPS